MRINKEGYKIICISGAVCVFIFWLIYHLLVSDSNVSLLWVSAVLLLLFWFFIVAFFREPRRVRIHDADLVFSPCDGRVVVTEVVKETEYLNEEMLQISIFMSVTNVHMNWGAGRGHGRVFQIPSADFSGGMASQVVDRERTHDDCREDGLRPEGAFPPDRGPDCTPHHLLHESR